MHGLSFFSCRMPPGAPRGSTRLLRGPREDPGALRSTLVPAPLPEVVPGAVPGDPQEKPTRSQGSPRRFQKVPEEAQEGPPGGPRGPLGKPWGWPGSKGVLRGHQGPPPESLRRPLLAKKDQKTMEISTFPKMREKKHSFSQLAETSEIGFSCRREADSDETK